MGFLSKKYECDVCGIMFRVGHNCYCKECKKVHPVCNQCYKDGKELGNIKDKKINIGDMDEEEREKAR